MEWFKETIELKSTLTTALGPVLNQAPVFDLYKFMTIMNVKAGIDTQHFSSSYNFTWAKFSNSVPTVWYLDNVTKWHVHVMCHTGVTWSQLGWMGFQDCIWKCTDNSQIKQTSSKETPQKIEHKIAYLWKMQDCRVVEEVWPFFQFFRGYHASSTFFWILAPFRDMQFRP